MSTGSNNEDRESYELQMHLTIRSANMVQVVALSRNSCVGSEVASIHRWKSREANVHRRRPMQQV